MAHFVRLEAPTGDARWVNADHVHFLAGADEGSGAAERGDGREVE